MNNTVTAPNVTPIPATLDLRRPSDGGIHRKRRTVGYARVSTDLEEQLSSYQAQVDYW